MVVVYAKVYSEYTLQSRNLGMVQSDNVRRLVFPPDNRHSIILTKMKDGCLCFTNDSNIPFAFTLSRDNTMIARITYNDVAPRLFINTQWILDQEQVINKVREWAIEWNCV